MLSDGEFALFYSSGEREPMEFFLEGLANGNGLDLALGYFSTSGFNALALGLAHFLARGGAIRIVLNDVLHPLDKRAIDRGIQYKESATAVDALTNAGKWYHVLSRRDQHFFDCIAYLVSQQRLRFKMVRPRKSGSGIVHQKFGIFSDGLGQEVAFNGSANFSAAALTQNVEALSCYRSWLQNETEDCGVSYFTSQFEALWTGSNPSVEEVEINLARLVEAFPGHNMDVADLLEQESQLVSHALADIERRMQGEGTLARKLCKLKDLLDDRDALAAPHLPIGVKLRQYQLDALEEWKNRNYCGLFEMATGTGKSLTALNCALHLRQSEGAVRALVLVPTQSLAAQWESLMQIEAGFVNTVVASGENPSWWTQGNQLLNYDRVARQDWILITTYATFATDRFQSLLSRMSEGVLLIADEVHNFGTGRLIALHPHNFKRRIALSATPARHFDEEGTDAILRFFCADDGPAYRFDMARAIDEGYLCGYRYFPRLVSLEDDELTSYREISKKLRAFFDEETGRLRNDPVALALLLKRKRIIHKARGKLDCLRSILASHTATELSLGHTLVYVPEGEYSGAADDSRRLIDAFAAVITREFRLTQHQFIGTTRDRPTILRQFAKGEIKVLTSMKCLDEGIDVPQTATAIFAASTGNPRQFIQRRGRVLRNYPGKLRATIFDMVVIPPSERWADEGNGMLERSLIQGELRRVLEFASLAENRYQALGVLDPLCRQYDIELYGSVHQ
jgi:superfamily II DNA or RNA helicase